MKTETGEGCLGANSLFWQAWGMGNIWVGVKALPLYEGAGFKDPGFERLKHNKEKKGEGKGKKKEEWKGKKLSKIAKFLGIWYPEWLRGKQRLG